MKRITRLEALAIAKRTMDEAEEARAKFHEMEAQAGISFDEFLEQPDSESYENYIMRKKEECRKNTNAA